MVIYPVRKCTVYSNIFGKSLSCLGLEAVYCILYIYLSIDLFSKVYAVAAIMFIVRVCLGTLYVTIN